MPSSRSWRIIKRSAGFGSPGVRRADPAPPNPLGLTCRPGQEERALARVLVIDDDVQVQHMLAQMLGQLRLGVLTASDGIDGVAQART